MTYRCYSILLIFFLFEVPAPGQAVDSLPLLQTQEYKQNSLSVDLSGLQVTESSGDVLGIGCAHCWVPYRGYERLSEKSFFEIAGQDVLARETIRSRRRKYAAMGLGGLSMIAGAVLLSKNFSKHRAGNPEIGPHLLGGLLIGGGGFTFGFSAMQLRTRSVPYSIARDVAQTYNARLLEQLGHDQ